MTDFFTKSKLKIWVFGWPVVEPWLERLPEILLVFHHTVGVIRWFLIRFFSCLLLFPFFRGHGLTYDPLNWLLVNRLLTDLKKWLVDLAGNSWGQSRKVNDAISLLFAISQLMVPPKVSYVRLTVNYCLLISHQYDLLFEWKRSSFCLVTLLSKGQISLDKM